MELVGKMGIICQLIGGSANSRLVDSILIGQAILPYSIGPPTHALRAAVSALFIFL